MAAYIRETIDSARRFAKGLYPIELSRYGLPLALEDLAGQTSRRFGIRCELRQQGEAPKLQGSAEIHIYHIVQECIANALKHGRAENVVIESVAGDGVHTFTVTNDGIGFETPAGSSGMGLHLMDYRARVIGATIAMEKPGEGGCRVTCRIPV
jgi:signal transduction histidine kinase